MTRKRFLPLLWAFRRLGRQVERVGSDVVLRSEGGPTDRRQQAFVEWLEGPHLSDLLRRLEVDLVLDVGANTGGFAGRLRDAGWRGPICSFEPQASPRKVLEAKALADSTWRVLPYALSDHEGTAELIIRAGSELTSLQAPRLESPIASAMPPGLAFEALGVEQVPVRRLDAVLDAVAPAAARRIFLKIDTQGHDERVLDGAQGVLDRVVGIQLELTQDPMYYDTHTWLTVAGRLEKLGYALQSIWPVFVEPSTGVPLEFDGIFVRRPTSRP